MLPSEQMTQAIVQALTDLKAENIVTLDVSQLTPLADYMVICTGNSSRHVKSLANHLATELGKIQVKARGIEGQDEGEWVLVDFNDVVVHIMQQSARDFYDLEKLWRRHNIADAA